MGLLLHAGCMAGQGQDAPPIVIDVTVLDRAGHPVTEGLRAGNFQLLVDGKPVKLLSLEPPGTQPVKTIYMLDEVNDTGAGAQVGYEVYTGQARMRDALRGFLRKQPASLPGDVEVFALTRKNFELVSPPTRDREALLKLLSKRRPVLPTPSMLASSNQGYAQALGALRVLALENQGVAGRKNIVWMGVGPGGGRHAKSTDAKSDPADSGGHGGKAGGGHEADFVVDRAAGSMHTLTDLMLGARMTLSAVGVDSNQPSEFQNPVGLANYVAQSQTFGFEGDTSFRALTRVTGGEFLDGNDVDGEMRLTASFGGEFYTLAYKATGKSDGRFRRLQVQVAAGSAQAAPLLAFTRAGRYALEQSGGRDAPTNAQEDLSAVVTAPVSISGLRLQVTRILRYADSDRASFTVTLPPGELQYDAAGDGKQSQCGLTVAIVALGAAGEVLGSQLRDLTATAPIDESDAAGGKTRTELPLVAVVPRATVTVRIALRDTATGRVGTVDVPGTQVRSAPETTAPVPALRQRGK